ncbi:MAG: rhomboid family intramembrane serine protease [Ectobacillus sp.]
MIFKSHAVSVRSPAAANFLLASFVLLWLIHPFLSWGVGCNECLARGEWWRIATSLFIHYEFEHLLANSFTLFLLGLYIEELLGKRKFLFLFLLTGIAGNIATYLLLPAHFVHTGASGALFGLLGAQLYIFYVKQQADAKQKQLFLFISLLLMVSGTFLDQHSNVISHLGGLLAGGILAPLLYKE